MPASGRSADDVRHCGGSAGGLFGELPARLDGRADWGRCEPGRFAGAGRWRARALAADLPELDDDQRERLYDYYLHTCDASYRAQLVRLQPVPAARSTVSDHIPATIVMRAPAEPRPRALPARAPVAPPPAPVPPPPPRKRSPSL